MTIRKGEQWGSSIKMPSHIRQAHSDAEIAQCSSGDFISITGGDIHFALGSPVLLESELDCTLLQLDALHVHITLADGSRCDSFAASCIQIGRFFSPIHRDRFICLTNGGIVDGRNIAPRAHPNDGRFDVMTIDASMSIRDRLTARKKAVTGSHLPHPLISVRQGDTFTEQRLGRHESLSIDGVDIPKWSEISVSILPDYWQIVV
jgi:hypothetical protein